MTLTEPYRVLVAEKIAESGVDMLRERFDVDLGTDWSREELIEKIGSYHGILIRSATQLDAEVDVEALAQEVHAGVGELLLDEDLVLRRELVHAAAGTPASTNTRWAAPTPTPCSTSWPSCASTISRPDSDVRMSNAPK